MALNKTRLDMGKSEVGSLRNETGYLRSQHDVTEHVQHNEIPQVGSRRKHRQMHKNCQTTASQTYSHSLSTESCLEQATARDETKRSNQRLRTQDEGDMQCRMQPQ
jgi:hypothetical protein